MLYVYIHSYEIQHCSLTTVFKCTKGHLFTSYVGELYSHCTYMTSVHVGGFFYFFIFFYFFNFFYFVFFRSLSVPLFLLVAKLTAPHLRFPKLTAPHLSLTEPYFFLFYVSFVKVPWPCTAATIHFLVAIGRTSRLHPSATRLDDIDFGRNKSHRRFFFSKG